MEYITETYLVKLINNIQMFFSLSMILLCFSYFFQKRMQLIYENNMFFGIVFWPIHAFLMSFSISDFKQTVNTTKSYTFTDLWHVFAELF